MFLLFLVLLLNLAISFWNASAVGRYWTEKNQLPGAVRFMMWCGAIMAVCGFFVVYVSILTMIMHDTHAFEFLSMALFRVEMSAADADLLTQNIFDLAYLIIIFPVLGTGLAIWANSVAVAYIKRDWASIGVASYNTFAQIHNTVNAVRYVPQASRSLVDGLSKIKLKGKSGAALVYLVLFLFPIVISLGGAIATTAIVMRASDEKYQLEDFAKA